MVTSTSPRTRSAAKNTRNGKKAVNSAPKAGTRQTRNKKPVTEEGNSQSEQDDDDDDDLQYNNVEEEDRSSDEGDVKVYDSDALDDDDSEIVSKKRKRPSSASAKVSPKRRKRTDSQSPKKGKGKSSPNKRAKTRGDEYEDDDDELEDGQEIVGRVVQAPTTGRVPPGQISQNTLDFLTKLKDPSCNDRQWFKLHEPVYRQAETEWKHFIEAFTELLIDVDPQIPSLPPKDVIHRIYRDVRFSNDKTPYKKGFSASFSRTGRKGIFAGYHVLVFDFYRRLLAKTLSPGFRLLGSAVIPGGRSFIAGGTWAPGRAELANIRTNIQRSSNRLRRIISNSEFVLHFGEARASEDGERQNIFGMEDELKVAPKGVEKDHKDIDLLKCRSFVVSQRFTDEDVVLVDFKETLKDVVRVMRPFVHCLNDLMTINAGQESDDEDGGQSAEE